jgi:hypothetical protein
VVVFNDPADQILRRSTTRSGWLLRHTRWFNGGPERS